MECGLTFLCPREWGVLLFEVGEGCCYGSEPIDVSVVVAGQASKFRDVVMRWISCSILHLASSSEGSSNTRWCLRSILSSRFCCAGVRGAARECWASRCAAVSCGSSVVGGGGGGSDVSSCVSALFLSVLTKKMRTVSSSLRFRRQNLRNLAADRATKLS